MILSIHNKIIIVSNIITKSYGLLFSFAGMWESKFMLLQEHVLNTFLKGLSVDNNLYIYTPIAMLWFYRTKNRFTVLFYKSHASKIYFIFCINRCLHRTANKIGFLGWNYLQWNKTFQVDGGCFFPGIFNIQVAQREYWHNSACYNRAWIGLFTLVVWEYGLYLHIEYQSLEKPGCSLGESCITAAQWYGPASRGLPTVR